VDNKKMEESDFFSPIHCRGDSSPPETSGHRGIGDVGGDGSDDPRLDDAVHE